MTLTLEPGVVVKGLAGTSFVGNLRVYGTLVADGTSAAPIVFTSFLDDSVGGDTNGDGTASLPAKGDWDGIGFGSSSTDNVLDNVVVRYAGDSFNFGKNASVYTATSSLIVSASTISDGSGTGIYIYNTKDSIISDNKIYIFSEDQISIISLKD